jgi:hypothetical protein
VFCSSGIIHSSTHKQISITIVIEIHVQSEPISESLKVIIEERLEDSIERDILSSPIGRKRSVCEEGEVDVLWSGGNKVHLIEGRGSAFETVVHGDGDVVR